MTLLWLLGEFLRIGLLAFGGGVGALPMVDDAATRHGWLPHAQFPEAVAIAQTAPGPYLVIAAVIGYHAAGWGGAGVATFGVFAGPVAAMLLAERQIARLKEKAWSGAVIRGASAATVGLLANVTYRLAVSTHIDFAKGLVAVAAAVAMLRWRLSPAWIIAAGAVIGLVFGFT